MKNTIKILSVLIVIIMLTMAALPSINSSGVVLSDNKVPVVPDVIGDGTKKYEKEFIELSELNSPYSEHGPSYIYHPLYEYYNDNNVADSVADYVLVFAGKESCAPLPTYGYFDNYLVVMPGYYYPYELTYWIYLPKESEVLTLREAYEANVEEIENIFTDYDLGKLMGDMDKDGKLTVKDATYIQKCLADMIEFPPDDRIAEFINAYISDFNRDGVRNVRDATAIQKHIAGIE